MYPTIFAAKIFSAQRIQIHFPRQDSRPMGYMYSDEPLKTLKSDRGRISIVGLPMETQSRFLKQTENIPEEIILEILSRLPVKSLLRFRCVCKVWKSLIGDPKFTLSFPRPNHKIAIKSGNVYSIDAEHGLSRDPLLEQMLFFDDENATKRLNILGSCNGLFLVSHYTDLYLWNPSTRESTKVLSLRTKGWPKDFSFRAYASGLCYDSSTDDYKAVLAKGFGKANVVSFKRKYGTTATFSAGETDDRSTATFNAGENDDRYELLSGPLVNGPVVNEKLHWAITSFRHYRARFPIRYQNERRNRVLRVTTRSRIVSFNPLTDKFEEFPMPLLANNGEGEPIIKGLGVLDGYLCMTRCVNSGSGGDEVGPGFFELLVMQEYGVGGSWTRILNVSNNFEVLSRGNLVPLCSTSDGEVVISSTHLKKLCAFNLEDMSEREIIMPSEGVITYQTSYVESLVSPAAYGHEEDWVVTRLDNLKGKRPKSSSISQSQRENRRCSRKSQQSDKDQTKKEVEKS